MTSGLPPKSDFRFTPEIGLKSNDAWTLRGPQLRRSFNQTPQHRFDIR